MSSEIIVAIIAFAGTISGTFGGIVVSSRLTNYRLEQLESKVNKHNNLIERTFKIEERQTLHEEQLKVANHRIKDLEDELKGEIK
jgi:hypothetical protein